MHAPAAFLPRDCTFSPDDWQVLADPEFTKIHLAPFDWKTSAARQAENFLDIGHFSWLHIGTFGNREKPEIAKYEVLHSAAGLHMDYRYPMITPAGESMQTFSYDIFIGMVLVASLSSAFFLRIRKQKPSFVVETSGSAEADV